MCRPGEQIRKNRVACDQSNHRRTRRDEDGRHVFRRLLFSYRRVPDATICFSSDHPFFPGRFTRVVVVPCLVPMILFPQKNPRGTRALLTRGAPRDATTDMSRVDVFSLLDVGAIASHRRVTPTVSTSQPALRPDCCTFPSPPRIAHPRLHGILHVHGLHPRGLHVPHGVSHRCAVVPVARHRRPRHGLHHGGHGWHGLAVL